MINPLQILVNYRNIFHHRSWNWRYYCRQNKFDAELIFAEPTTLIQDYTYQYGPYPPQKRQVVDENITNVSIDGWTLVGSFYYFTYDKELLYLKINDEVIFDRR